MLIALSSLIGVFSIAASVVDIRVNLCYNFCPRRLHRPAALRLLPRVRQSVRGLVRGPGEVLGRGVAMHHLEQTVDEGPGQFQAAIHEMVGVHL